MYERSAVILEKYFAEKFGYNEKSNLKSNHKNYCNLVEILEKYQEAVVTEDQIIKECEDIVNVLKQVQSRQASLYRRAIRLQEDRSQIFEDIDEPAENIEKTLIKIEKDIDKNSEEMKPIDLEFTNTIKEFSQKSKTRSECGKSRRKVEKEYKAVLENATNDFGNIDKSKVKKIQNFLNDEAINDNRELKNRMVKNGENEKIPFDIEVIENSIAFGRDIHKKEVQFLIDIYLKNTGLLNEINGSAVKTQKYKKAAKNSKSNLEFIKVQKEYLIQFLDNERLSVSLGKKEHKKMMKEACQDFKKDLEQIENLNELLSREISGKATQKAYKELYDSEYLEELIKKEEDFERKVSELNLVGKIVNPIYWRIDGMKKVYEIFDKIVKEEYGRSLSKFKTQKSDDEEEEEIEELLEESLEKIIIQEANKEVTTIYEEETDEETYENIDMLLKRRKEKLKKERITTKSKNTKKGGIFGKFTTKK